MSPAVHGGLHSWSLPIVFTLALFVVALAYAWCWYQVRSIFPKTLTVMRFGMFLGGALALWVAVASPLAVPDHQLLTIHMVQHLLLMTVAAPLLLLGAPGIVFVHGFPQRIIRNIQGPVMRCPPMKVLGRIVTHPVSCWLAATVVVVGWHVATLFALGKSSERWHVIEHASLFAAGLLSGGQ